MIARSTSTFISRSLPLPSSPPAPSRPSLTMAESSFSIALPSLDDDDDQEELFSYPASRFGHPSGESSSSSSFEAPNSYHLTSSSSFTSNHNRGPSTNSSDAYGGGRKDSIATSTSGGGGGESGFSFPQQRSTSVASGGGAFGNTQRSNGAGGVGRGGSIGSIPVAPHQIAKKGSFVSLKSAFSKAGGGGGGASTSTSSHYLPLDRTHSANSTSAVPPLPESTSSGGHPYPALRNPFSRAASSSNLSSHNGPPSSFSPPTSTQAQPRRKGARPSGGPSISSTSYNPSTSFNHQSKTSQYSIASSGGGGGGGGWSRSTTTSPPPLPNNLRSRGGFPTNPSQQHMHSFSNISSSDFASSSSFKLPHPDTPSLFALHLLVELFQKITSAHFQTILSPTTYPLSSPLPPIATILGPGVDKKLDGVLDSLGMVSASGGGASRPAGGGGGFGGGGGGGASTQGVEAKAVLDSLLIWRNQAIEEEVGRGVVRSHV